VILVILSNEYSLSSSNSISRDWRKTAPERLLCPPWINRYPVGTAASHVRSAAERGSKFGRERFARSGDLPVQPYLQKYFCFLLTQITFLFHAVPALIKGRIAIVTNVGQGCGGRECVVARERSQGGLNSVSDRRRADERRRRGRQSRVVLAPVAGVKLMEERRPDRAQAIL
jgi:hypothetical protein